MKNLTTALNNTEALRPKQRVLLLVHDSIAKDRTGERTLTDADRHALNDGWKPKDNSEVDEFNKYIEGWSVTGFIELDAQIAFLNAQNQHLRKQTVMMNLIYYPYYRDMRAMIKRLTEIRSVDINEAVEITEKQKAVKLKNGLDFDYAVYQLAFESLAEEDQKQFSDLYCDVEFDHQYLDEEEVIASLLNDKGELTQKSKEKLAAFIAEKCYNKYSEKYQLYHYFAGIPLAEIARRFLMDKGIAIEGKQLAENQEVDDEDTATHDHIQKAVECYGKDNSIRVEEILKGAFLKWVNGDLFDQYAPLALSSSKDLFERWLSKKAEARGMLKKLIAKGELKIRDRSPDESRWEKLYSKRLCDMEFERIQNALHIMDLEMTPDSQKAIDSDEKVVFAKFSNKIITGESLYDLKTEWKFIKEFKDNVDTFHPNAGLVYADDDPNQEGKHEDREFLVGDKSTNDELNVFSVFSMTTRQLRAFVEATVFFQEVEEDGQATLVFKEKLLERVFLDECKNLVKGYGILLAFDEIFKKLSKIFEIDLSHKTEMWLATLNAYIDNHNEILKKASGQIPHEEDRKYFRNRRQVLLVDPAFFIDREKIAPDWEHAEAYVEKLKEIFRDEYPSS